MGVAQALAPLLIANRGEIAVRVARTCRELGIKTVAVYSDADARSLHVRACDTAIGIGGRAARDSYLRGDLIIAAAQRSGARSVHPGYGFLSENADFAQGCADAGLAFVGPSPAAMRAVGDKIAAKKTAIKVGVPVLAGYLEREQSTDVLREQAQRIGTPLLIKAAAGGGGRGMRLVEDLGELDGALDAAQREAKAAFGDATVFLERFVRHPRHIEVQILADDHGTCLALGERECSIQRRYQKVLEESPSPAVDSGLREQLERAAVAIAAEVGYTNAGTVEFMLDEQRDFYFLEMNARLQVEHPVTEMVTGLDLVALQLAIAAGERIVFERQPPRGHAIEVRIYAEDPAHGFLPSTGTLRTFIVPQMPQVRNDVAVEPGSEVSAEYDPMLAKLIVHAMTRDESVALLARALESYLIGGVATNLGFLRWLAAQPVVRAGKTTTDFLDKHFRPAALAPADGGIVEALAAAGASQDLSADEQVATAAPGLAAWRSSGLPREVRFASLDEPVLVERLHADGGGWRARLGEREAVIRSLGGGVFSIVTGSEKRTFTAWGHGGQIWVAVDGVAMSPKRVGPPTDEAKAGQRHSGQALHGSIEAPMSGTIVKVNAAVGDAVEAATVVMVMEAMKMEHAIAAPYAGILTKLHAQVGRSVNAGDALAEMEEG